MRVSTVCRSSDVASSRLIPMSSSKDDRVTSGGINLILPLYYIFVTPLPVFIERIFFVDFTRIVRPNVINNRLIDAFRKFGVEEKTRCNVIHDVLSIA